MPVVDGRQGLADVDFDAVERAVLETEKGRWFLAEHARRHRVADTQTLLDALRKIERAANPGPGQADVGPLIDAIRQTRAEIAAVRNHMLEDGGALPDTAALFDTIVEDAKTSASELMSRTGSIQTAAGLIKADGADTTVLEHETSGLQSLAWRQDVMSQRIGKALGLLAHIGDRLESLAGGEVAAPPKLTQAHLDYFKRDEDIFAPAPMQREPVVIQLVEASPAPEKPRIVMIRRPADDGPPLPSEGDSAA
jgi:hypothetical protein